MENISRKALKEQYKSRVVIGGVYRIKCSGIRAKWLRATTDMKGAANRYQFLFTSGTCPEPCMAEAWKQYGPSSFSFEVMEELQKKETQTDREFSDDVNTLLELWLEKQNQELEEINEIKQFLDNSGKIMQLPQKEKTKVKILLYLAEKFQEDRSYTEKEVNDVCGQWNTFGDFFLLRRELVDHGLLCREVDGSAYWRPKKR